MSDEKRDPRGGLVGCERCSGGGCPRCWTSELEGVRAELGKLTLSHLRTRTELNTVRGQRDAARAELVELRATVERVRALASRWEDSAQDAPVPCMAWDLQDILDTPTPGEGEVE